MASLTLLSPIPAALEADAAVVLAGAGEPARLLAQFPAQFASSVQEQLDDLGFKGAAGESVTLAGTGWVRRLVVCGTGLKEAAGPDDHEAIRAAAGAGVRSLQGSAQRIAVLAPTSDLARQTAEGALLATYSYDTYRSKPKPPAEQIIVIGAAPDAGWGDQVTALAEAIGWVKDLVNTPPLDLFPASFAAEIARRLQGTGVEVEVRDEAQLEADGLAGLIGVGRGSARPPRMVTLSYRPQDAQGHVALVGKGITFDSGGLSLKPPNSMPTMKSDMAGAATVAGVIWLAARLRLPISITGYLCLAENMTGADAQRPGDVLRYRNGKTVEVINTDAEGRLVLADGLCLASEAQPDLIVDIATLTGGAVRALGPRTGVIFANNPRVREAVFAASDRSGEPMWELPLDGELRAGMKSLVADLKHHGPVEGGTILAALFLQEFIGDAADDEQIPWSHWDIAGPAYLAEAKGYNAAGATGYGLRSLLALLESQASAA